MQYWNLRKTAAYLLLFMLIIPLIAACGGGTQAADPTAAPAAGATAAPAAGATEPAAAAATEAPAAAATEAPAAAATAAPVAAGAEGAVPGTLRIWQDSEPATIDPQKTSFLDGLTYAMMAYQPLLTFDLEGNTIPAGAESFEVSEDGLIYTFKIPADSKYSDGSPLTAENYEYAWKRLANPETAGEYQSLPCGIIKGYSEYSAATCQGLTLTDTLALDLATLSEEFGVRAVDPQTLEIELVAPAPYFAAMTAIWIGLPVREEDAAQGEDWWFEPANIVGNGPWMIESWEHDQKVTWVPNPNYVGPLGPSSLEKLEFYIITESQVAFQAYQNNELDIALLQPEDLATVQGNPELNAQAVPYPGSCTLYFGFNLNKPPFDNLKVRQAFAQAFDREAWVRDIFQGLGAVADSWIPAGFPGYEEGKDPWAFDAAAAQATLAEAGFPNGEGLPEIKLTYSASARNNARFEWVANQLRTNLGIEPVLDPVDPTAYTALFTDPETTPAFFSLSWCADYPDPQNWISILRTGGILNDRLGWTNAEFDQLTQEADVEQDETRRAELYAQAHEILLTEAPVVITRFNGSFQLTKPWVKGISEETVTPLDFWYGFYNMANISIEP